MAVVRITQELRNSIMSHARNVFKPAEVEASTLELPATCTAQTIYDRIFGEWKDAMFALPSEIVPRSTEFEISRVVGVELKYTFVLPTPHPLPTRLPSSIHVAVDGFLSARYKLLVNPTVDWADLHQAALNRAAKMTAFELRRTEFETGVSLILTNHATLAPALKAWPPLWDLLPEGTKDRHRQVVDRKAIASTLELDTSKLTSAMVIAKLTR